MFKTVNWNTGSAAERFRLNRKKIEENRKRNKATSHKPQASSALKRTQLKNRIKT
jgi:hypothetical protein